MLSRLLARSQSDLLGRCDSMDNTLSGRRSATKAGLANWLVDHQSVTPWMLRFWRDASPGAAKPLEQPLGTKLPALQSLCSYLRMPSSGSERQLWRQARALRSALGSDIDIGKQPRKHRSSLPALGAAEAAAACRATLIVCEKGDVAAWQRRIQAHAPPGALRLHLHDDGRAVVKRANKKCMAFLQYLEGQDVVLCSRASLVREWTYGRFGVYDVVWRRVVMEVRARRLAASAGSHALKRMGLCPTYTPSSVSSWRPAQTDRSCLAVPRVWWTLAS